MKIAIIGCGIMGKAIAQRLAKKNQITLYDHNIEKANAIDFAVACKSAKEAIAPSELVILAIKPQSLEKAAPEIARALSRQIVVSLLSGTSLERLKRYFPNQMIYRIMPNLPIVYGEGLAALTPEDSNPKLLDLFKPLGKIYPLSEDKFDAFTSLAGSGPAFIYVMIEAMVDAGIAMGFNASLSKELVLQMMKGSLTLLEKSEKHPGELKWEIASPAGTTIAGLKALEEGKLRASIINTFLAAYERAQKM